MQRVRVSTTVDGDLLAVARARRLGLDDSALFDAALAALVRVSRTAETDAAYAAYDDHPLDEADEWGDWRRSVAQPRVCRSAFSSSGSAG